MTYTPNTQADRQAMLQAIGAASIADLFAVIPPDQRLDGELRLPPAMGELELTRHMRQLAATNSAAGENVCFLGGGSYDHFIPAVVDAIASRGEFYTSYTPYQPEVSQGNLQAMFEYQTLICQLTGMDVANASLYDGGSAAAEAALLSMSVTRRAGNVVVPSSLHPEYREILATYLANCDTKIKEVPCGEGTLAPQALERAVGDETACVILQQPNFFGCLEDVAALTEIAHRAGALVVSVFDPIGLGLLKRPGDLGIDVAVAEGQSLGSPMSYGGPYLGVMACREKFVRRLPGRIAGQTVDRRGRRCWVLTLQTREQHIRREKATSNICTNQGLFALRATVYLATMGPAGLRKAAELSARGAHYAAEQIAESPRLSLPFNRPFFKEFVVRDHEGRVDELLHQCLPSGIFAGIPLKRWYPELADCFLVTVTEKRTRREIDLLARCLTGAAQRAVVVHA